MVDVVQRISSIENDEHNMNVRMRLVSLKEVQALFRPFHLVQTIFVLSKYQIRGNMAVQNSFIYNVFSGIFIALQVTFIMVVSLRISHVDTSGGIAIAKLICDIEDIVLLCLGTVINLVTNIVKARSNALLPLAIQNLYEIIRLHAREEVIRKFTIINWMYVAYSVLMQTMCVISFQYTFSVLYDMDQVLTYLFYIIYDINVLYGARIVELIRIALKLWIDDVRKSEVAESEREEYFDKLFEVYVEIFEAYKIVVDAIHPLVLYFYIIILDSTLSAIYIRIEIGKIFEGNILTFIFITAMSLFWLYKDLFILVTFSFVCERFYTTLKEVKTVCVQMITSQKCSDAQKRVCKNIIRHQEVSFVKMNACGLFVIDAALILNFASILTTYVIVVFQFEFL